MQRSRESNDGETHCSGLPVCILQLGAVMDSGYDAARSLAFYRTGAPSWLLWARIVPDSVFIFLGVVPLVLGLIRGWVAPAPDTVQTSPLEPEIGQEDLDESVDRMIERARGRASRP